MDKSEKRIDGYNYSEKKEKRLEISHLPSTSEVEKENPSQMKNFVLCFKSSQNEKIFQSQFRDNRMKNMRTGVSLGGFLYFLFSCLDYFIVSDVFKTAISLRFVILISTIAAITASYMPKKKNLAFKISAATGIAAGLGIVYLIAVSSSQASNFYYVGLIPTMMWLFYISGLRYHTATFVSGIWIITYIFVASAIKSRPFDYIATDMSFLISSMIFGAYGAFMLELSKRKDFIQKTIIQKERAKSENLLLNILPAQIAMELKKGKHHIVKYHSEISALFLDIVNFTPLASTKTPEEIISLLNRIFTKIDHIVEDENVEKIKTIGDAYFAVSGAPVHNSRHAVSLAQTALKIRNEIMKDKNITAENISIRMGIHSGPVVAGVIGQKKFAYDLWGDTINIASRMESTAEPGKIQLSGKTAELLAHEKFKLIKRGDIQIKGKGKMFTFYLES